MERLAHAVIVQSTVPAGRVVGTETGAARAVPGVLAVYTVGAAPRIAKAEVFSKGGAATENFLPLQDDLVRWNGQHVALVVAETFEQATEAAALVRVEYQESKAVVDPEAAGAGRTPLDKLSVAWATHRPRSTPPPSGSRASIPPPASTTCPSSPTPASRPGRAIA
nr:hypothetical protein [Chenggangzhangella methanolivorans]